MSVDKAKTVLCLVGVLCTGGVHAAQSLLSIYEMARSHSPELQAARLNRDVAAQKWEQSRSVLRPSVRLLADAGRQLGASAFEPAPYQDRGVRNWSWSLQLSQALLRPGATDAVQQAELETARAEVELRRSEQELMVRVSQLVLDRLTAQRDVDVAVAHQRAVERQVRLADHNFMAGLTPITDVHEANAQLHLVGAQLATARSVLAQRHAELERLLGDQRLPWPSEAVRWELRADDEALKVGDTLLDTESHPTLVARRLLVQIAEIELQRQTQAHRPSADLTLGYGHNASTGSMTAATEMPVRSRVGQVGVRLTIPLYEGGMVVSRVREAALLREKAEADLRLATQQIQIQARQAWLAMTHEANRVDALELAHKASEAAVNANRVGYRVGTRIGLDVLNAEQQRFSTERDMHKAIADRLLHVLRLKAARGALAESDLSAIRFDVVESHPDADARRQQELQ